MPTSSTTSTNRAASRTGAGTIVKARIRRAWVCVCTVVSFVACSACAGVRSFRCLTLCPVFARARQTAISARVAVCAKESSVSAITAVAVNCLGARRLVLARGRGALVYVICTVFSFVACSACAGVRSFRCLTLCPVFARAGVTIVNGRVAVCTMKSMGARTA